MDRTMWPRVNPGGRSEGKGVGHVRAVSLVGSVGLMVWLSLGTGSALAAPGVATPSCQGDPYTHTAAALIACGDQVFPLQSKVAMPGGGIGCIYKVDGMTVEETVPPQGFNPVTATASELQVYAYPPRPPLGHYQELQDWKASVTGRHVQPASSFLVSDPNTRYSGGNNVNWAGYSDGRGATYSSANAIYNEPIVSQSYCTVTWGATWTGLGGLYSPSLVQAGTAIGTGPGHNYGEDQAWYEILPSSAVYLPLFATQGKPFYVYVGYFGVTNNQDGFIFYLTNQYTGASLQFAIYTPSTQYYYNGPGYPAGYYPYYDGSAADFIEELPPGAPYLTDFNKFGFDAAYANGNQISDYPWWESTLYDYYTGDTLVTNGILGSRGFTLQWDTCY